MRVYLVQHAEAKREEEDPLRGLSEKGLRDINRMAKYAEEHLHIRVDRIIHSGKLRAQQTAEMLAQHVHSAKGVERGDGLEPQADPKVWSERLAEAPSDLMLVGHLPHLSRLASRLLCGDDGRGVVAFKMVGIVCLERDENSRWTAQWIITPDVVP